jgi:hypothetical protein
MYTLSQTCGILDSVACKMDPVRLLHQGNYFLDRADRRLQEGHRRQHVGRFVAHVHRIFRVDVFHFREGRLLLSTTSEHGHDGPGKRYAVADNSKLHAVLMSIRTIRAAEAPLQATSTFSVCTSCLTLHFHHHLVTRGKDTYSICVCTCKKRSMAKGSVIYTLQNKHKSSLVCHRKEWWERTCHLAYPRRRQTQSAVSRMTSNGLTVVEEACLQGTRLTAIGFTKLKQIVTYILRIVRGGPDISIVVYRP